MGYTEILPMLCGQDKTEQMRDITSEGKFMIGFV